MKVLLINPPTRARDKNNCIFPLNLVYIGDALLRAGFEVRIRDFSYESDFRKILSFVKKENPNILGLTCFAENRGEAYKLLKLLREQCPETKIIAGGHFFSSLPGLCLENFDIDAIVIGDGEKTVAELARAFKNKSALKRVRGIAYKEKGKTKTTKPRPFTDINTLPVPDFKQLVRKSELMLKTCPLSVMSMRGCRFKCSYCVYSSLSSTLRMLSPQRFVEELKAIIEFTDKKEFCFGDSVFTVDKERVGVIADIIKKERLDLNLWGQTRAEFMQKETCSNLRKMGFSSILLGIESFNREVLSKAGRKLSLHVAIDAFRNARDCNLPTCAGYIVGLEGDSLRHVLPAMKLIKKINPNSISVSIARLYPGTGLYNTAKAKGLISDDFWLSDTPRAYYTGALSITELLAYRFFLEFGFSLHRGKPVHYLHSQVHKLLNPPIPRPYLNIGKPVI